MGVRGPRFGGGVNSYCSLRCSVLGLVSADLGAVFPGAGVGGACCILSCCVVVGALWCRCGSDVGVLAGCEEDRGEECRGAGAGGDRLPDGWA